MILFESCTPNCRMHAEELAGHLKKRIPLAPLIPRTVWNPDLTAQIESLDADPLVKAGLHLMNDDGERCHVIVQDIPNPEGNYFHAIHHRREPDFSNSKYWYRQVGVHPVLARLREHFPDWDPFRFVDWCQGAAEGTGPKEQDWLQEVQGAEMTWLLEYVMEGEDED